MQKLFAFSFILSALCTHNPSYGADAALIEKVENLKWEALLESYPADLTVVDAGSKTLKVKGGATYVFDQHPGQRSYQELFDVPDLEDTFYNVYPLTCSPDWKPQLNFEPGRFRNEPFLKDLFGHSESEVEGSLVQQKWLNNQGIRVTTRQKVSEKFARLARFFEQNSMTQFLQFVWPSAGAFNYRPIAGTNHLSSHSFGNAMDVNTKFSNYWKWDESNPNAPFHYTNHIPCEVIEAFENEGFVSGAKWYHYDTMHFEYHPELIAFAKKLQATFGNDLNALKDLPNIRLP